MLMVWTTTNLVYAASAEIIPEYVRIHFMLQNIIVGMVYVDFGSDGSKSTCVCKLFTTLTREHWRNSKVTKGFGCACRTRCKLSVAVIFRRWPLLDSHDAIPNAFN